MKKFMLATALLCFGNIVCPDTSVKGMNEAQMCFQENRVDDLYDALTQDETYKRNFAGNKICSWLKVINRHIDDPQYVDALNMLLMFAAGEGNAIIVERILQGNAETLCDTLRSLDDTAIHEAADCGQEQMLETFLRLRPGSDFAVVNCHGYTPLNRAIFNSIQIVQWFLNLHDITGKDIGLSWRNDDGCTVLGQAVEEGNLEIVHLLIDHRGRDGNYCVSVENPVDKSPNVLTEALCYGKDGVVNVILESGRVGLNDVIDTFTHNRARNLSPVTMARLRNMATDAGLLGVLGALDVYGFWQALDSGDEDTAIRLFNSENFDTNAVAQAIVSRGLELKEESYARIPDVVANMQSILSALDIYNFRKALNNGDQDNVRTLLTSERVSLDDVIGELNSNENMLSPQIYNLLKQIAQNSQRQDVIQALQGLDRRVFQTLFHGRNLEFVQYLRQLTNHFFQPVICGSNLQAVQTLLTSERVSLDDVIGELNLSQSELPLQIYRLIRQIAQNSQRQDLSLALIQLDRRVCQAMIYNHAWQDMIELLRAGRIILSSQMYNGVRRSINADLRQETDQNQQQALQNQLILLDLHFLRSRFTSIGWNELPNLLDSHQFDNLIRGIHQRAFNGLRNLALQAQQRAVADRLDRIRGNRAAIR